MGAGSDCFSAYSPGYIDSPCKLTKETSKTRIFLGIIFVPSKDKRSEDHFRVGSGFKALMNIRLHR